MEKNNKALNSIKSAVISDSGTKDYSLFLEAEVARSFAMMFTHNIKTTYICTRFILVLKQSL